MATFEEITCKATTESPLDLAALFKKYGIAATGVIHVGAFDGEEVPTYRAMGFLTAVYIEASPLVAAKFAARWNRIPITCAVADYDGTAMLNVANNGQSSSILPLAEHARLYPGIKYDYAVKVPCLMLDSIAPIGNFLHLDIQGAELKALRGASRTLERIDAIVCEVNMVEMYKGCPLIGEIDEYLSQRGFRRVELFTGPHPEWGDAFYVRQ
jgi:FkbM family methyltransferase